MTLERPELKMLAERGWTFSDPAEVIDLFEREIAAYAGAPFAVAVDSATHAIELSLRFLGAAGRVEMPKHTYPSVPMTVLRLGCELSWTDTRWEGVYRLSPWPVIDGSVRFRPGMYEAGMFHCLSFQFKKRIGIGRGGMILTDRAEAYHWLKRAGHDGRSPGKRWHDDRIEIMGFHYQMIPEDAARGLLLFDEIRNRPGSPADTGSWRDYPDLTSFPVFK
jgi:dTDP-4-amino-4,6-dideoxygalactose transaminase